MNLPSVLKKYYSLDNAMITPMEGYASSNFRIELKEHTYVLKVYEKTRKNESVLKAENTILEILSKLADYEFPNPIKSIDGKFLESDENSIYRLLSFIEGDFLIDIRHSDTLLSSFGTFLARMDKELSNHSDIVVNGIQTQWDLKHFNLNKKYIDFIENRNDKKLLSYFFLQYEEIVIPEAHRLRQSIIHNDPNDLNVLAANNEIAGIIDFGDMCHSWLINELAIALTYIMMNKESPLECAFPVIQAYNKVLPLKLLELDILYYLVAARLCTSVCNSAYAKTIKPKSDYITISEKPAWDLLRRWLRINPLKARDQFRKAAGYKRQPENILEEQLTRRKKHLSTSLSLSYNRPIEMYKSAFQYMYDIDGNTYLDAYNNIMLAGHCHPIVVRAGQRTMARLNTNTRYIYEELLSYSEKLLAKFPAKLNKVFFVNSGSAASDLAYRMATTYTRKRKIMVLEHGYHGNTGTGIDMSHYKYSSKGGGGAKDHILEVQLPKVYGSGFSDEEEAANHFSALAIEQITRNNNEIAAFIAEPIVGCGGQVPLPVGYLERIYPKIRSQGGVCISDEVQVGFGRLGKNFWGYEFYNVVPDMIILGKPMGNGHPIGAVVTTTEIASSFETGPEFFSSFGGNPVSCAIGNAVLDVIESEGLQEHAQEVGSYLKKCLTELQKEYPEIGDIRGHGLFIGVEITDKEGNPNTNLAVNLVNALRENFILTSTDGPFNNVIKIKPPLAFTENDASLLCTSIGQILKHLIKS
ncbi:aminotransferase class III-fold pyridoxal phosphate-dependent enzyme [uncultured Eudoraea sp.]|uniref:aminotransferase class III-fold pyridoxal phosphate-dependent enzyme n=1 Tax=uncultured Eudoraea sp. TaxID=1035614 RepID=UPI0026066374|nr:aminotransferase class III-fold pyridoxal phosphate-dependent enzyme [uncultured Eudoraea sp.]